MGFLKDLRVFYSKRDKRVHVEKTPVAEIAAGATPPREAIVLQLEQPV